MASEIMWGYGLKVGYSQLSLMAHTSDPTIEQILCAKDGGGITSHSKGTDEFGAYCMRVSKLRREEKGKSKIMRDACT
ncbi:hypothetical protein N7505_004394 [Penicillium chrysogenum]|uniref:Uncharacterized protein n=1 Tax=Penicillium chrysogenum TaxID=5076 RepID=A0ABQ8WFX9_PENCH|nr:hypothetical protein N7524_006341 [Penicillium chrysogenum]KAJ5268636.1 hypothetical protein N7505_004394 [Penicillium chrysogenum]